MGDIGSELRRRGLTDDGLIRLYLQAQEQLIRIIERADPTSPFRRYRVQQERAIDRVLVRLRARTRSWTAREIEKLFRAGTEETAQEIRKLGEEFHFAGVNEQAIRILTEEAYLEFGKTMSLMKANGQKVLMDKRKLQEEIIQGVAQGSSFARTQKQLVDQLRGQGVTVLRARNGFGRRFNVEHYTNMLVRTQSMTAYNLGAKDTMLGSGRRFAIFPTIRPDIDGEDICNEWERKKFVDLLKDPLPPASTHPNAVFAGSTFVGYGHVLEMITSEYEGPAITLHAGEYRTSIGPNHPMLTSRGMVPAKFLMKGDQLVYDSRAINRSAVLGKHHFNKAILIEDCFDSVRSVCGHTVIPTSSNDFHGDAPFCKDEIEVVFPERELLTESDSFGLESFRENGFMGTDMQMVDESGHGASALGFNRILLPTARGMSGGLPSPFRLVHIDRVEKTTFRGRAFDCSTSTSLYCNDGFVVSNCRHVLVPAPLELLKRERPDLYRLELAYLRETVG